MINKFPYNISVQDNYHHHWLMNLLDNILSDEDFDVKPQHQLIAHRLRAAMLKYPGRNP